MSLPLTLHYCWFGGRPLPASAQRCLASWRRYAPQCEIVRWDESNYDVDKIPYTAQAYEKRKYAFVADYARYDILHQHGGLNFDTDVELLAPIDSILEAGAFMCREIDCGSVNPGLGMGAPAGHPLYREMLDEYERRQFLREDGSMNLTDNVVALTTAMLRRHGLTEEPGIQDVEGIRIFTPEYFNPMDSLTGRVTITPRTVAIHRYDMSWLPWHMRVKARLGRMVRRLKK